MDYLIGSIEDNDWLDWVRRAKSWDPAYLERLGYVFVSGRDAWCADGYRLHKALGVVPDGVPGGAYGVLEIAGDFFFTEAEGVAVPVEPPCLSEPGDGQAVQVNAALLVEALQDMFCARLEFRGSLSPVVIEGTVFGVPAWAIVMPMGPKGEEDLYLKRVAAARAS